MLYNAKEVYKDTTIVAEYDRKRFSGIRGKLIDWMEKRAVSRAVHASGVKPPATVLDLPSGTGRLSYYLAQLGYRVTGVDLSPVMVQKASTKSIDFGTGNLVHFIVGNGEALDFDDNTFDLVVSLRLFGHLPPDVRLQVTREFSRVSRGIVITTYYLKGTLQELLRRKKREQKKVMWFPVSIAAIDKELAQAGLLRVKMFPILPLVSETLVVLSIRNEPV